MKNFWTVREADQSSVENIINQTGLLPLTARILCARSYDTPDKVRNFLSFNASCDYDPFLMKDMDKAVARIKVAIENKERVCIYGDYDVDGVTSTTILYTYLSEKGVPCTFFIPGRLEDGYGLNKRAIENLSGKVDLIITVDTGITAVEETEYAKSIGIDMVITDHHSCREVLPSAVAVVNPHREDCAYPFKQLAGVGVVYKLLSALDGGAEDILKRFGDIIAIGTIADVMPIVDENRYITANGIRNLQNTGNLGLRALMECCGMFGKTGDGKKINSVGVGFVLAPRINAAGRIRNAKSAVELLLSRDYASATALAEELCNINKERQITELEIYEQAIKQIDEIRNNGVYVLGSDGWHQGVIGVVASRITERYSKPSILFSFDGDVGKGSGRSIRGFSMLEALSACSDLLTEYGGHELAAGLTIKRDMLEAFSERINAYASERLPDDETVQALEADAVVSVSDLNLKQAEELSALEPFGLHNSVPLLMLRNAVILDIHPLSGGKHIKLRIRLPDSDKVFNAVYFGMQYSEFVFRVGDCCDIMFTLEANEYRGVCEAKLFVKKMRYSADVVCENEKQQSFYTAAITEGNRDDLPASAVPTLLQFRALFRILKREAGNEKKRLSLGYIQRLTRENKGESEISFCALRIIFDVLTECKLAECSFISGSDLVEIKLLPFSGKVNLDKSPLLIKIKENHKLY